MVKIFVFKVDSKNEGILVDKMSLLSLKEREKLSKYKYDKDRNLSLAGRLMLFCFAERFKDEKYGEVNFVNDLDEFCKENTVYLPYRMKKSAWTSRKSRI